MKYRLRAHLPVLFLLLATSGSLVFLTIPPANAQNYSVLYTFNRRADGWYPYGPVTLDRAGNLYGTTANGGSARCLGVGCGTAYKLDASGQLTVLYVFGIGGNAPWNPLAGMIRDREGNLYGTLVTGGPECQDNNPCEGAVFELTPTGTFNVLQFFSGVPDGDNPESGLVRDKEGYFYGTTYEEGNDSGSEGTVYKMDTIGDYWVLHSFPSSPGDGALPVAGVTLDQQGNLYGTASAGGDRSACNGGGCGVVFKLDTAGNYTLLHSFNGSDGENPESDATLDLQGNLYGTTLNGGTNGLGVIFKIDTAGNFTVLHNFGGSDGANPQAGTIFDLKGNLYGTTLNGGANGLGEVYRFGRAGNLTVLHSFAGSDGANPYAGLIFDAAGNLYGTTVHGGQCYYSSGCGVVFRLNTE